MGSILNLLFRGKKTVFVTFAVVLGCVLIILALKANKYEAHMSFMMRNERADPLVSADPQQNSVQHGDITEENINSEVELLSSTQLLQEVVWATGLDKEYLGGLNKNRGAAVERATRKLSKDLIITPVRKSSIINVSYSSKDRERSVAVLNRLAELYVQKHATLHTGGTAASFFRTRSLALESQLRKAEEERAAFLEQNGYSILPEQNSLVLQQTVEASKARDEVGASLAETESRLRQTRVQQRQLPSRIVTQDRTSANQYSVERLNTMLADLQNRRTEMVTKFRPNDRLVTQIDKEILDTQASLSHAEQIHSNDQVTDVNPLHQSLDADESRLLQTRVGLLSRKAALDSQLDQKRAVLAKMESDRVHLDEQNRGINELETNLNLYRTKAATAEIADDLDLAKIGNVVVAASPIVPVLPAPSPFNIVTGLLLAAFASLALGLFSEMQSKKLYGPAALEAETGFSVLATLPRY